MVERVRVDIATGEVTREGRYLLTSLSPRKCEPRELLRLFRNHWSIENSQRHVKDRSWEEDVPTLRRPGLGEVSAALVNTGLNALRLLGWFPGMVSCPDVHAPDVHAPASQMLRLPADADHRTSLRTGFLTLQSSCRRLSGPFILRSWRGIRSWLACRTTAGRPSTGSGRTGQQGSLFKTFPVLYSGYSGP